MKVQCQLIETPQVDVSSKVLGSRLYRCWVFEHGVNEFGVAIGNAAVHSKEPFESPEGKAGLISMDIVRTRLERGRSTYESIHVLIDLLEKYSPDSIRRARYHNNFLIADAYEAWVLEAAGRCWVAEKITDGIRAVSNLYTIEDEWNAVHLELVEHAVEVDWCRSREVWRESVERMKAGKREGAIRNLQRFVKEMRVLLLEFAEELDLFLRRLDSLLPEYPDLRGEYSNRLDEEVELKRDDSRRNE